MAVEGLPTQLGAFSAIWFQCQDESRFSRNSPEARTAVSANRGNLFCQRPGGDRDGESADSYLSVLAGIGSLHSGSLFLRYPIMARVARV